MLMLVIRVFFSKLYLNRKLFNSKISLTYLFLRCRKWLLFYTIFRTLIYQGLSLKYRIILWNVNQGHLFIYVDVYFCMPHYLYVLLLSTFMLRMIGYLVKHVTYKCYFAFYYSFWAIYISVLLLYNWNKN